MFFNRALKSPDSQGFVVRDEVVMRLLSKALVLHTIKPPTIPAQLAQQSDSGYNRVIVKATVGFAMAGVLKFPATADALVQNGVATAFGDRHGPAAWGCRARCWTEIGVPAPFINAAF